MEGGGSGKIGGLRCEVRDGWGAGRKRMKE